MNFSRKNLGIPYAVFLMIFVVAPLIVLVIYAFTNGQGQFTLENLTGFFTDPNTLGLQLFDRFSDNNCMSASGLSHRLYSGDE